MKLQVMVLLAVITGVSATTAQEVDDAALDLDAPIGQPELNDVGPIAGPGDLKPAQPVTLYRSAEQSSQAANMRGPTAMTAAQLRQARALYRSQQRIQRLEMYKWLGYEPLRPHWVTIPSMTSRYQNRTIYVPVYIYNR